MTLKASPKLENSRDSRFRDPRFEAILEGLTRILDRPSPELPSIHCLSRPTLHQIFGDLRKKLKNKDLGALRTNQPIFDALQGAGLLLPLPAENPKTGQLSDKLFVFDIRSEASLEVHPIEILQALEPQGIVCYFTALEAHELTTQPTPHHHVAVPVSYASSQADVKREPSSSSTGQGRGTRRFNPLGTALLRYRGMTFYKTRRDSSLLVARQIRYLDSRNLYRVTTLEQTLIDTLHRPLSCGGPEVVFESWENALDRLDDDLLAQALEEIGRDDLIRRVGWMLETLERSSAGALNQLLAQTLEESRNAPAIELFRGYENPHLHPRWRVMGP